MRSGLTPVQRILITRVLVSELAREWTSALAAGAPEAELSASAIRRHLTIEAMLDSDATPPGPGA